MTHARIRANEAQKNGEPVRPPGHKSVRQHLSRTMQQAAPDAPYRHTQVNRIGLRPADFLTLQRTVGNRMVQRTGPEQGARQTKKSSSAAAQFQADPASHTNTVPALATIQRMSIKERDALNADDYGAARFNKKLNNGYRLFTIWHNTEKGSNIQVHWHPISDKFPAEIWTVRWANENKGSQPALDWMKEKIRATPEGTMVALASMQKGGAEYKEQFPAL